MALKLKEAHAQGEGLINGRKLDLFQAQVIAVQLKLICSLTMVEKFGNYKYRLKQIDLDGTFEYSSEVEVEIHPDKSSLEQNYPNPFNPSTRIQYQVSRDSHVSLKIYDVLGNEVATLVNEFKSAGKYQIEFYPVSSNQNLASGIYYYQLKAGSFVETKKMIYLK